MGIEIFVFGFKLWLVLGFFLLHVFESYQSVEFRINIGSYINDEYTLPKYGMCFRNPIFFEQDKQRVYAVIITDDTARAAELWSDNNLWLGISYFEFVLIFILKEKRSGTNFVD